jgi:hypothetical protein
MKQNSGLIRPFLALASLALVVALFACEGCSGGGDASTLATRTVGKSGLEPSEYIALKKANKGTSNFQNALQDKRLEKLQAQGVVVEKTGSGKSSKKPR